MKKLRLLSVRIQPVLFVDDGDVLEEFVLPDPRSGEIHPVGVATIPAAKWPGYAAGEFLAAMAAWEKKLNEGAPPAPAPPPVPEE